MANGNIDVNQYMQRNVQALMQSMSVIEERGRTLRSAQAAYDLSVNDMVNICKQISLDISRMSFGSPEDTTPPPIAEV